MLNSHFRMIWASLTRGLARLIFLMLIALFLPHIAVAQKRSQVEGSILGVSVGARLDEARVRLDRIGTSDGRTTRDGGRKEAWHLRETAFASIALKADAKGRVVWVSGFLRPGREIPFDKLGELTLAEGVTGTQAIWNVETPSGGYRLVAKGQNGKAGVVYLLSLAAPPVQ
jgi:hypothetical protein